MKKLLVLFAALAAVLLFNTLRLPKPGQPGVAPPLEGVDEAALAQRLAGAIRIPTISHGESARNDPAVYSAFADYLAQSFPRLHAGLKRESVGPSLLYTWVGSDPKLKPVLLLAHMDVVPVEPGTEGRWHKPAFSGEIADGFIWGRGALDDKASLMAQMEAIESLVASGFQPARTFYIALGHDEEIGGKEGAKKVAELLKARGLHFEFALDEGGAITEGIVAGLTVPVASIMAAEKGYASFRLTARDAGGHSSRPPKLTAVGRLSRAIARLQDQPFEARLAPPVTDMLDRLAPHMPFSTRLALANRWLFSPLIERDFAKQPITDAMIRTTTAPTIFHAGIKDNVLPSEAYAVVNFRLLPGDSVQGVEAHIRAVVDDAEVEVAREGSFADEPSPVADTGSASFALIERVVNELYPEAVVSTGLVIGATDLRNYAGLYDHRYNFTPFRIRPEDLQRVHGTDERVGVSDYARGVRFYTRFIEEAAR